MKLTYRIARALLTLVLPLIVMLPLTGCATKPLRVMPAQPLPAPKIAVPAFLQACPPMPSWYPKATCEPAPTR